MGVRVGPALLVAVVAVAVTGCFQPAVQSRSNQRRQNTRCIPKQYILVLFKLLGTIYTVHFRSSIYMSASTARQTFAPVQPHALDARRGSLVHRPSLVHPKTTTVKGMHNHGSE